MQKLEVRLQKKKDTCGKKKLSPLETDKACANLLNRVEGSEAFLAGLKDRLRILTDEAAQDAAAGHPWPNPDAVPRAAPAKSSDIISQHEHHKAKLLQRSKAGVPE